MLTSRDCGDDDVCNPDLSAKVVNVIYTNDDSGQTENITVWVQVSNTGEDSFRTYLVTTFDRYVFTLAELLLVSDTLAHPVQGVECSGVLSTAAIDYNTITCSRCPFLWCLSVSPSVCVCVCVCVCCA